MSKAVRSIAFILVALILIVALVAAYVRFALPGRSFPQIDGDITMSGLDSPVDIIRDSAGVPHIYASTTHNLFFAQGYVHAQDRFWQMDFWRHLGSARLSEMFGDAQLETDKFLRALGWARIAETELAQLDESSLGILRSYAEGVNAYLSDHQGAGLGLEYAILGLLTPDYSPEPWQPVHTLTWVKVMAWDLGGNMGDERWRASLLKTMSPEQVDDLFPPYPTEHPLIVPEWTLQAVNGSAALTMVPHLERIAPGLAELASRSAALSELLGPGGIGIGSNSWALSGELTDTGMPLLANDPHLGAQMPSIWYEVGLHCEPIGPECPLQVRGFSFAGAPGVVIGHNDRIAWGFTNVGPDVQDLYIEKINPANPNQYEVNGEWENMELVEETIQVAGGDPIHHTVRLTRHGPLIWEEDVEQLREELGVDLPSSFGISLRWTALQPIDTFPAIWKMNLARDFDEFRAAAQLFDAPSQNLLYADVDGNIGYQMPGLIPIRAEGHDGTLPVPGWTDDYDWQGWIPFEELPHAFNPPKGYIATANNAVVGSDYPYLITTQWAHGYRAQRIVDMIEQAPGPIDIPYIQMMQGDNMNLSAVNLIPILLDIPLDDDRLEAARAILEDWDYQQHMDSAPAALYEVFWNHLQDEAFEDELPPDSSPWGGAQWFEVLRHQAAQPDASWWDDQTTTEHENRDDIFIRALTAAVDELEQSLGKEPLTWAWGELHTITFQNQTLGQSGIGPVEALFNRGPMPTSGGSAIVNATGWNSSESYEVVSVPSMRMIVDLGNLQNSLSVHTTGQSGHPYHPHYADMADPWRTIEYNPMHWERSAIEADQEGHLRLAP